MKILLLVFVFLSTSFFSIENVASQVNIESKRVKSTTKSKFLSEVGIDFNDGEVKVLEYNVALRFDKKFNINNSLLSLFEYKYGETDSEAFKNELFFHTRFTSMFLLERSLGLEFFVQTQKNEFFDIKLRQLLGFVIRKQLFHISVFDGYLGLGVMKEWEELENNPNNDDYRLTNYLTFILEKDKKYKILNTTYYQPLVTQLNDYRVTSEFAIIFEFTKVIGLKNSIQLQYDSNPPKDIERYNLSLNVDLIFKY